MAKKKKTLSKKYHKENLKLLVILLLTLSFVLYMAYSSLDFRKDKSYSKEDTMQSENSSIVTPQPPEE